MEFYINKASNSNECPCKEAFKVENNWKIELNSLEDLIALSYSLGKRILLNGIFGEDDLTLLIIDYR